LSLGKRGFEPRLEGQPGAAVPTRVFNRQADLVLGGWISWVRCVKLGDMKKQLADQSFHDRRHQERKRAEAAKKVAPKKVVKETEREGAVVKKD